MDKILVIHGPNLDRLGTREPGIYGSTSLEDIDRRLGVLADSLNLQLQTFQTASESAMVLRIHQAAEDQTQMIMINPGAFTHTSVAVRDALSAVGIPFIEVHLSNVHARESFRRHSFFSDLSAGTIAGFGPLSYELALHAAAKQVANSDH